MNLTVQLVTVRASARSAPSRPAGYADVLLENMDDDALQIEPPPHLVYQAE
jgi:hypothetical protein